MGPPPVCRPTINDWAVVECGSCPFEAPELRPIKITGVVSNHPILEDGPIITTLVQMIDQANSVARTLSTEYQLGVPSAAFAAQLAMLGGAPLKYISERATRATTRAAEQLASQAARPRRVSAAQDMWAAVRRCTDEPPPTGGEKEEASAPPSFNSRLCMHCLRSEERTISKTVLRRNVRAFLYYGEILLRNLVAKSCCEQQTFYI